MTDQIRHRGPDDSGYWVDDERGLVLGHRRLSIIDLSESGSQPMISACGRYVLSFNGEIYNHLEIREELDARGSRDWRGHSDTETLIQALSEWGLEESLKRLNGMFGFAVWDREDETLALARDRMGEKPLFYGTQKGVFLFGSELKALRAHESWDGQIDRDSLTAYFRFNYVPAPRSIYKGIRKLLPGHFVIVKEGGSVVSEQTSYWNYRSAAEEGLRSPLDVSPKESQEQLNELLLRAVKLRMAADVPLGAFLSGGIDSSLIVALMQAQSSRPVQTFTIGFHEAEYNEATHAKDVANHIGTDHTELYLDIDQATSVIPRLPSIWDEPFADSSQIPTLLVSELARRHVTVSLSGDGGDELFFGYDRYLKALELERFRKLVPDPLRGITCGILERCPSRPFHLLGERIGSSKVGALGDRIKKSSDILSAKTNRALYLGLMSHSRRPTSLVLNGCDPETNLSDPSFWLENGGFKEQMGYIDSRTYLPDDILVKVDRASMAYSLEARVPLLDHEVVEFTARVPFDQKYRNGQTKWLLRQVLHEYVPKKLLDRPKKGFGVPIELWLRGSLRDWAEDLLDENRLIQEGFLEPSLVRTMWSEHVTCRRRWHYHLWDILMFQAWLSES